VPPRHSPAACTGCPSTHCPKVSSPGSANTCWTTCSPTRPARRTPPVGHHARAVHRPGGRRRLPTRARASHPRLPQPLVRRLRPPQPQARRAGTRQDPPGRRDAGPARKTGRPDRPGAQHHPCRLGCPARRENRGELLEAVFLLYRLPAWGTTLTARSAASPKIHVLDSGVAARLLRLTPQKLAARSPAALTESPVSPGAGFGAPDLVQGAGGRERRRGCRRRLALAATGCGRTRPGTARAGVLLTALADTSPHDLWVKAIVVLYRGSPDRGGGSHRTHMGSPPQP
jgi:hypothetical protein